MRRALKWIGLGAGLLLVGGFIAFLYFIPPFMLVPPEDFISEDKSIHAPLDGITDPAERRLAEHGRYIVATTGCTGCHTPQGDQGPVKTEYLAGGNKLVAKGAGGFVARNLTPDAGTGLARLKPEQVERILRTGLNAEGRIMPHRLMPWAEFSHWSPEDRHAVVVYLRHIKAVHNPIPPPDVSEVLPDTGAVEGIFVGDFSGK